MKMGYHPNDQILEAIIRRLDIDGDKKLNVDEFIEALIPLYKKKKKVKIITPVESSESESESESSSSVSSSESSSSSSSSEEEPPPVIKKKPKPAPIPLPLPLLPPVKDPFDYLKCLNKLTNIN